MATKKKTVRKKRAQKSSRPAKKATKRAAPKKVSRPAVKKAIRKPAPRSAGKKSGAQKPHKKIVSKKSAPKKAAPAPRPAPKPAPVAKPDIRKARPARAFHAEDLAFFRAHLQKQLELIQGNLNALASDNLKRSPIEATGDISAHSTHMADQGTDNFDRELALNLASSRQDSIYDIEDAIRRIDDGSYGACEACGKGIERARLKALPFAKKCMACQNAAERGRTFYRPFGGTLPLQQLAAEDAAAESPESIS
jgi:DnaK suppressor protein